MAARGGLGSCEGVSDPGRGDSRDHPVVAVGHRAAVEKAPSARYCAPRACRWLSRLGEVTLALPAPPPSVVSFSLKYLLYKLKLTLSLSPL